MFNYIRDKRMWSIPKDRSKPIYRQIEDLVVRHIQSGRIAPGQPLPSYPWLSTTLGVADKTVRQAYASLQQAGVVTIQPGRGTFVSSHFGSEREPGSAAKAEAGALALVISAPLLEDSPIWYVAKGVMDVSLEVGLAVMVEDAGHAQRLAARCPEGGMVLLGRPDEDLWRKLMVLPVPKVWAGNGVSDDIPSVALDYEVAGRDCGYKLVGCGHQRIGFLRPERHVGADSMEHGIRHALGTAGLAMDPGLIQSVDLQAGETGWTAAGALLDSVASSVIVFGETLLAALSECLWRKGVKVPDGVSVVAVRSVPGTAWVGGVNVDSVVLDPREVGRRAVRRLQERPADGGSRVERIAPVWQEGESLSSPALS